tara:strand:- start:45970 stop:47073 length:1104 start_codon:yes stop_codon:yes gene_type:complete
LHIGQIGLLSFRSIKILNFEPDANLNFITGANNAGKTSLLESVYVCSTSKSFKNIDLDNLIDYSSQSSKISVKCSDNTINDIIIYEKTLKSPKKVLINQKKSSIKDTMLKLPVIALNFGNQNIFTQKSEVRRSLLDWGVFHVKQDYHNLLKQFNRILVSRNKVLKTRDLDQISLWTDRFIESAQIIHSHRQEYFDQFNAAFINILNNTPDLASILYNDILKTKIAYKKGWTGSLEDSLTRSLNKDIACGFTSSGPHRADFAASTDKGKVCDLASMSTQVVLNFCITLAQSDAFHVKHNHKPVLLIDDLFFGIDDKNLGVVIKLLNESELQCFLTAPDSLINRITGLKIKPKGSYYQMKNGELMGNKV